MDKSIHGLAELERDSYIPGFGYAGALVIFLKEKDNNEDITTRGDHLLMFLRHIIVPFVIQLSTRYGQSLLDLVSSNASHSMIRGLVKLQHDLGKVHDQLSRTISLAKMDNKMYRSAQSLSKEITYCIGVIEKYTRVRNLNDDSDSDSDSDDERYRFDDHHLRISTLATIRAKFGENRSGKTHNASVLDERFEKIKTKLECNDELDAFVSCEFQELVNLLCSPVDHLQPDIKQQNAIPTVEFLRRSIQHVRNSVEVKEEDEKCEMGAHDTRVAENLIHMLLKIGQPNLTNTKKRRRIRDPRNGSKIVRVFTCFLSELFPSFPFFFFFFYLSISLTTVCSAFTT